MSVAVVQKDSTLFLKSFGHANIETNTPVTESSVFELASLTKPFTALAILKLVEEGKLSLENSLASFFESPLPSWEKITVYHLLTHTAGFPDQLNLMVKGSPVMDTSTDQQIKLIKESSLKFEPGTSSSYSDPGYFLLGVIIEKVSGLSYDEYMEQTFFNPLGMVNTQIQNKWQIIPGRVAPYRYLEGSLQNARRDYMHELPSHFGLISTIQDLTRFVKALHKGKVVNKELLKKAFSPGLLNNGHESRIWGVPYGMGWMLGQLNEKKYVEHGGFSGTHLIYFPNQGFSIIVLTNLDLRSGSNPRSISHNIVKLLKL